MNKFIDCSEIHEMVKSPLSLEKRSQKQELILEAARKRFLHYGVSKTTMSDIAEDIQMAVGSLYLHFKNKEDIVLAIAEACRSEQDRMVESILMDPGLLPNQRLEAFF